MRHISLLGCSNKQHIIYPMLYILKQLGRTALITEDKSFLILNNSLDELEFYIEDIFIKCVNNIEDAYDTSEEFEDADFVIWNSFTTPFEEPNAIIITDNGELYDTILDANGIDLVPTYIYKEYKGQNKSLYNLVDLENASKYDALIKKVCNTSSIVKFRTPINNVIVQVLASALDESPKMLSKCANKVIKDTSKGGGK